MKKIFKSKCFFWSLLVVVAFLWGMSFFASTVALEVMMPTALLAVRWTIAAVLFLILAATGIIKVNFKGKPIKYIFVISLIQPCLYSFCELYGIKLTTTSESSLIIALIPIVVILISQLFLKEKYDWKVKGAIAIAFLGVGVSVCFSPSFSFGGKGLGYAFLFVAIVLGGIFNIMSGRISKYFSAFEITFTMAVSGSIWFNAISFIDGNGFGPWREFLSGGRVFWSALYLGLGCSFLAYLLYNYILSKLPAGIAACLQANTITFIGVISGIAFAGDSYGWYTAVGMGMVLLGIGVTSLEGNKSLSKYKTIIFDLDGTVLDTLEDITFSLNKSLRAHNLSEKSLKQVRSYLGNGFEKLIERATLDEINQAEKQEILEEFRKDYSINCAIKTKPYHGVINMLEKLKKQGYLVTIASNKEQVCVTKLNREFFSDLVQCAVGAQDGYTKKPKADMIEMIMKKTNTDRKEVLYIGDSQVDIETAQNAGVDYVLVEWGFRNKKELLEAGCKQFLNKPEDIFKYLK